MASLVVALAAAVAVVAVVRAVADSDSAVLRVLGALLVAAWWVVRLLALLWWRTFRFVRAEVASW